MNTKSVLLAYATRFGSTQEVAESIADTMRQNGLSVDMQPMQAVKSIDQYAAVVLGAAIYNAKWHSDAHQFLAQHRQVLTQRPVAIFALGPLSTSSAAMRNSRRQLEGDGMPFARGQTLCPRNLSTLEQCFLLDEQVLGKSKLWRQKKKGKEMTNANSHPFS